MKTNFAILMVFAGFLHGATAQQPKEAPAASTALRTEQRFSGVEFHQWQQGQPPVRLIRKDEGFCALTSVTGRFEGDGEQARVYVGADDYWYLGGKSAQRGVAAECMVVRYPEALKPENPVKILAASYSFGSQYADVTARVRELLQTEDATFQANPWCLLTDPQPGWNKALVIFCEVRGQQAIYSVGEGENVNRSLILQNARLVPAPIPPRTTTLAAPGTAPAPDAASQ